MISNGVGASVGVARLLGRPKWTETFLGSQYLFELRDGYLISLQNPKLVVEWVFNNDSNDDHAHLLLARKELKRDNDPTSLIQQWKFISQDYFQVFSEINAFYI